MVNTDVLSPQRISLTLAQVGELSLGALLASNTSPENADPVAKSIVAAEADGMHSHGLMRLGAFCDHVLCGKVDGYAVPTLEKTKSGAISVDAACGFAHPAIDTGFTELVPTARKAGIGALAVRNSYNCGVLGHHVERLARQGLIGMAFVNAPAAIAPWGGKHPLFGTNPIALACPRRRDEPILIDQSSSVIARGEIMLKARQGRPIPDTWGLDHERKPTTDPIAVLNGGSMAPAGGHKGVMLALIVEILSAALTGANLSMATSSLTNNEGGPPRMGQFFVAIDPNAFSLGFADRVEVLCAAILDQAGTRLPGQRRSASRAKTAVEGIEISRKLFGELAGRVSQLSFVK